MEMAVQHPGSDSEQTHSILHTPELHASPCQKWQEGGSGRGRREPLPWASAHTMEPRRWPHARWLSLHCLCAHQTHHDPTLTPSLLREQGSAGCSLLPMNPGHGTLLRKAFRSGSRANHSYFVNVRPRVIAFLLPVHNTCYLSIPSSVKWAQG